MRPLPLRALPRIFVPGADPNGEIELPPAELRKLRHVLRLSPGAEIAVLPNDGSLVRCTLGARTARPLDVVWPQTEAPLNLTVAQARPKGDKLDEIVRACTEIGVSRYILFPSDRTVTRWDDAKQRDRVSRLATIAREASEVSFRTRLPTFEVAESLSEVLRREPAAVVLSEVEGLASGLRFGGEKTTIVVGPEGGWSDREIELIGNRGITLGPRVLRVDHAAAAAAAILLLRADA